MEIQVKISLKHIFNSVINYILKLLQAEEHPSAKAAASQSAHWYESNYKALNGSSWQTLNSRCSWQKGTEIFTVSQRTITLCRKSRKMHWRRGTHTRKFKNLLWCDEKNTVLSFTLEVLMKLHAHLSVDFWILRCALMWFIWYIWTEHRAPAE